MISFLFIAIIVILGSTFGIVLFITKIFLFLTPYQFFIIPLSLIFSLFFVFGTLGANTSPRILYIWLYRFGAVWIGGIVLAFMIALGFFGYALLSGNFLEGREVSLLFLSIALLVNIFGIFSSFSSKVVRSEVHIKNAGNWKGKSIVMISDTHYGHIYSMKDAKKLVKKINTLHPDIVLIPGDFFDGPKIDFFAITHEFKNIRAAHGVYFSNGNHEEYRNTDAMLQSLSDGNIHILNNRKVEIDGIQFAGVTYHETETSAGLISELDRLRLDSSKPTILLKHKPTLINIVEKYPINLAVSGHTHKGQMWPFSLLTYIIYGKYAYGTHIVNENLIWITSSGVGSWGPPQRIGSRSEIVEIHIK